ncbi:MAG: radical SAM protein [Nitrospirota bacterium]
MKIALIIPRNTSEKEQNFYDLKFISKFLFSKKYFAYLLAVPTLVSLTPPEHEVRVFDENIEEIDYEWDADLVGISVRTMFANRAYRISDKFREKGVKTVLGGIHPTMCTDEALRHCDTVVIGEADNVWHTLLHDARNGGLKSTYKAEKATDMTTCPTPAWSVLSRDRYISDIVQTTKGCPFNCEFCSVYAFDGQRIRNKTVAQVIEEIKGLGGSIANMKRKAVFFADDNIIANKKFSRELFLALKEHNVKWSCQASINIAKDDEILRMMKDCGCGAMLIGLESISEKNLSQMNKGVNLKNDFISAIKKIQSYGMLVNGSFILGYDFDSQSSFDELIDFIEEAKLLMPVINILTPFPGTKLFQRLDKEGRIIHKDWSKYDSKQVVFLPALLTPDELLEGHKKVIRQIYSFDSIYKRLQYYWSVDFWRLFNEEDPIKFKYRLLFALRLLTLLFSSNLQRSKFILRILPRVFGKRIRISTVLALMAYNDYAYS